jgi:hypothetical protein
MTNRMLLVLFASTVLASGALAQSNSTTSGSSAPNTTSGSTTTGDQNTGSSNDTTIPKATSSNTGTSDTGGTSGTTAANQNPNPNIYGNRGNQDSTYGSGQQYGWGQSGGRDNFAQQNPPYGNYGGPVPWGYFGGPQAMSFGSGGSMTCVSPAPSPFNQGIPGSFACFPSQQQMSQMGPGGMGWGGYGGQQMGQSGFGFDPYGWNARNYDRYSGQYGRFANRYGPDESYNPQGGYNPYMGMGPSGYGQYGMDGRPGGYDGQYGFRGQYGTAYGNEDSGQYSPNWYYANRQRQMGRNYVPGFDSDRNSMDNFDRNRGYARQNQYDNETTGSTSRPDRRFEDRTDSPWRPYEDDNRNFDLP